MGKQPFLVEFGGFGRHVILFVDESGYLIPVLDTFLVVEGGDECVFLWSPVVPLFNHEK
jgi:hypothetical protein